MKASIFRASLIPRRRLDAARHIDGARPDAPDRLDHVSGSEAAREDNGQRQRRRNEIPVEHRARTAVETLLVGVEKQAFAPSNWRAYCNKSTSGRMRTAFI